MGILNDLADRATAFVDSQLKRAAAPDATSQAGQAAPSRQPDPRFLVTIYQPKMASDALRGAREATVITAYLPASLNLNTDAHFEAPYADGFIDNAKLSALAQLANVAPTVQSMSTQFWKGSSPTTLTLPLVFIAENSSMDVMLPVMKLRSLCMPRKMDPESSLGILEAPGPRMSLNTEAALQMFQAVKDVASSTVALGVTAITAGDTSTQTATEAGQPQMDAAMSKVSAAGSGFARAANELIKVDGKISVSIGQFLYLSDVVIENVDENYDTVLDVNGIPIKVTVTVQLKTRTNLIYDDVKNMYPILSKDNK